MHTYISVGCLLDKEISHQPLASKTVIVEYPHLLCETNEKNQAYVFQPREFQSVSSSELYRLKCQL